MSIDPHWTLLGRTDNATFYLVIPRVLVVVPDEDCTDDESTARQSIEFQQAHWRSQGLPGAALVLMDRVIHQTQGARRVYQAEVDPALVTAFALVSSTSFGRAVASAFVGLTRPPVPTRMFDGIPPALQWVKASLEGLPALHTSTNAGTKEGNAP
jgi:hypothetical protein